MCRNRVTTSHNYMLGDIDTCLDISRHSMGDDSSNLVHTMQVHKLSCSAIGIVHDRKVLGWCCVRRWLLGLAMNRIRIN